MAPDAGADVTNPDRPHVLVLGAGPAGLFAAKTLADGGARVTIADRATDVGGLAAGTRFGGNWLEGGVHHLHAFDAHVFEAIKGLLGDRLLPIEKSALIRYGKGFCRYPLQFTDIVRAMPPWTLVQCCAGLAWRQLANALHPREPADGEQALVQLYGAPLYRTFFRDFTHRYWGFPPSELSAEFIRKKMPRLSAFDALRNLLGKVGLRDRRRLAVESAIAKETLYYTPAGAHEIYQQLARHLRARGAELLLRAPLAGLETRGARVVGCELGGDPPATVGGFRFVISTVPLPDLVAALGPSAPAAVHASAQELFYKPVSVLGLLVRRERVLDALYVYFRDRSFHRIGEPKLSGLEVTPADHTILVVELTAAVPAGDAQAEARVRNDVCRELAAEGLIAGAHEVAEHAFVHRSHAYPVYLRGFEQHLARIRAHLAGYENLISTGRQGDFAYPNMHQAMRMGHDAALRALAHCRERGALQRV